MLQCCHVAIYEEFLDQNLPVCWSFVVKEKPRISCLLAGAFPSDRVPKETKKAVYVHFLINSIISCKLSQRIPGKFSGVRKHEIRLCANFSCLFLLSSPFVQICSSVSCCHTLSTSDTLIR